MAEAWGGSWGSAWGVSWGSTPTPTPTATPLPNAGNAAGDGHRYRSGSDTYADIARWTRRGTAVRVAALSVQTRRPWLQTYAEIRWRRFTQRVAVLAEPILAKRSTGTAALTARPVRLRAMGLASVSSAIEVAVARQTERQDVADILAVIDLIEEMDDQD